MSRDRMIPVRDATGGSARLPSSAATASIRPEVPCPRAVHWLVECGLRVDGEGGIKDLDRRIGVPPEKGTP